MNRLVAWGGAAVVGTVGAVAGAAAYFLDPGSGEERRQAAAERVGRGAGAVRRESAHVAAMISRQPARAQTEDVPAGSGETTSPAAGRRRSSG